MTGQPSLPLVTVILRTYQSRATLELAVASVLAQTVSDLECLIVDDGSSDGTAELVASFSDRRVRYIRHTTNLGRSAARKTGLSEARGRFIGWLDADDWWYPSKLERQLAILEAEAELPLVSCGWMLFDGQGGPIGVESADPNSPKLVRHGRMAAPGPCPMPTPAALYRREVLRDANLDLSLPRCEDFDFILPILLRYSSAVWSEPMYAYAVPEKSRHRAHAESAAAARRVYAKYVFEYPLVSLLRQGECLMKQAAYAASARLSNNPRPLRRRGRPPTTQELANFQRARDTILQTLPLRA